MGLISWSIDTHLHIIYPYSRSGQEVTWGLNNEETYSIHENTPCWKFRFQHVNLGGINIDLNAYLVKLLIIGFFVFFLFKRLKIHSPQKANFPCPWGYVVLMQWGSFSNCLFSCPLSPGRSTKWVIENSCPWVIENILKGRDYMLNDLLPLYNSKLKIPLHR